MLENRTTEAGEALTDYELTLFYHKWSEVTAEYSRYQQTPDEVYTCPDCEGEVHEQYSDTLASIPFHCLTCQAKYEIVVTAYWIVRRTSEANPLRIVTI